jgi:hypothetical protein
MEACPKETTDGAKTPLMHDDDWCWRDSAAEKTSGKSIQFMPT